MARIWTYLISFGYAIISLIKCDEVTLLDTREAQTLNWATYTTTTTGQHQGWREGSSGENRVYFVCDITSNEFENWLRTPYIYAGDANRLYIEMSFTMRKCEEFDNPEALKKCKESFTLYSYGADSDISNANRPTWDTNIYNFVDVVAADKTFTSSADSTVNLEVRSVEVTHNGLYFAFLDSGMCSSLQHIRIYYITCPTLKHNFATFPTTPTSGDNEGSIIQKYGVCVSHAAIEESPKAICNANGQWYFFQGGCKCMPGYQPDDGGGQECDACEIGKYKWRTGSERCYECPDNSEATVEGSVECQCVSNYYRNVDDEKSESCTRPPSAPRDLRNVMKNQSAIRIEWSEPSELGGRNDLTYNIEVIGDTINTPVFKPSQQHLDQTSVIVTGLLPEKDYKLVVTAVNGVSDQSDVESSDYIVVRTDPALPPKVSNIRFTAIGARVISMAWDPPPGLEGTIEQYQVLHDVDESMTNATAKFTTRHNITFNNLNFETEYFFKIRAQTSKGWGDYSNTVFATTGSAGGQEDITKVPNSSDNLGLIIGAAVAVVVCLFIVIVMVCIFIRRNNGQCNEKGITECDTLAAYGNVQCQHLVEGSPAMFRNGHLTMPLFTPPGGVKTYIDPHTYEDPNQAVREFTKEIDASFITIESVIGGGEFGDVCKGRLRITQRGDIEVAIKTLKPGASDKNRLDFLTEASIMGQFDDPNVIFLEGVVTKSTPNMIVMEFMENGALDAFLRNNDGKFTVLQLVGMMRGIASGMRYLSDMGYIHRDLAARNILVSESLVCKVADFGLSREIESDDTSGAYTTKGGKIPVRWTAPEAIAYRKFTSAADVWSYGVVMWEVMSYGERPYWNWSNQDVIKAVDKGFRLPPPMDCPEPLYALMSDCWVKERNQRPKFPAIVKSLDKLIRSPENLRNLAKQRPHPFINPNKPDLTNYTSVEEWLRSIKMDAYLETFLHYGITAIDSVAELKVQDLVKMNITLVGHQKKIMNSVQNLRVHIMSMATTDAINTSNAQVSNGFVV